MIKYDGSLVQKARKMRKEMTPQERHLLYDFLRVYPQKFLRQKPIAEYIVDFYCNEAKLAIELDGSQHYEDDGKRYDDLRTRVLNENGIKVLRFSNYDINTSFDAVCEMIDFEVKKRLG